MVRRALLVSVLLAVGACSAPPPQGPPEETLPDQTDAGTTTPPGEDAGTSGTEDAGSMTDPDAGSMLPDAGEIEPVVRFIAIGDTGKGNDAQKKVAAAIVSTCAAKGCDFVVMLGDNIYDSGASSTMDQQFQDKFEIPYQNINLTFWVALGNHDYGGGGAGTEYEKGDVQVEYTQHSTKWKMPAKYYRFAEKHVEFFAMDTNMQMFGLDMEQEADITAWLDESTAVWKIMLGHHPYKSNGPHGNAGNYEGTPWLPVVNGKGVKDFAEDIWCGKADVSLSGHDHNRQWLQDTCQGTELLVSGAGASTTELEGSNPAHFERDTLGFAWVEIKGRTFKAEFIDENGTVEFTRTVSK